jgi:hypothetical protein
MKLTPDMVTKGLVFTEHGWVVASKKAYIAALMKAGRRDLATAFFIQFQKKEK